MRTANTKFFGSVNYEPEDVIDFPSAIPPFADSRFVLISLEAKRPLVFLQSVDNAELCFVTAPARVVDPAYTLSVSAEDLAVLKWSEPRLPSTDDLTCLAILTVAADAPVTANLLAPVLIHATARLGLQALRADLKYTHAHPLPGGGVHAGH